MEFNCDNTCDFSQNQTHGHLWYHLVNKIPTTISHKLIDLLPKRSQFLDKDMAAAMNQQITKKMPTLFIPTTIIDQHKYVNNCLQYEIYMFGVLPCGSKTLVILDNIDVTLDVLVPTWARNYDNILRSQLINAGLKFLSVEKLQMYPLHGFTIEPHDYRRIYFTSLHDRAKVIQYFNDLNKTAEDHKKIQLAGDDMGSPGYYISKVARENKFATASWNRISDYEVLDNNLTTNCKYVLRIDVKNIRKIPKAKLNEYTQPNHPFEKIIDRDPTMMMQWDIEMHSPNDNGQIASIDGMFTIFMMNSAYFWHHSAEPLFDVCVVDSRTKARPGIGLVIECGTERNVLMAHMDVIGKMCPEISSAFNGSSFDWRYYREKLRRETLLVRLKENLSSLPLNKNEKSKYKDTETSVFKFNFRRKEVKIDAENNHIMECVADFPGMLDIDVLPIFLKLYTRMEVRKAASLNFFLEKNKLPSKEDMPYKRMFKIYERSLKLREITQCHCDNPCQLCTSHVKELDYKEATKTGLFDIEYSTELHDDIANKCCFCGKLPRNLRDMGDVGYYCTIDCIRPQQLCVKRMVVVDKRELSTMSCVSLYDSFYRADGMKVRNYLGKYCHKWGIAFPNGNNGKSESQKDHYPGAWVFPPNRGLHSDGKMDIVINGKIVTIQCRPIFGLDFASLYPSLMMTYNLSPDMVVYDITMAEKLKSLGYSIHHIEKFQYERGEKKGAAGNAHLEMEAWTVRHNGVHNKTAPNIVTNYTKFVDYEFKDEKITCECDIDGKLSPDDRTKINTKIGEKFRRTVSYKPTYGRSPLPNERMGIFPFVVKKLFDKRVPVKKLFLFWEGIHKSMSMAGETFRIVNYQGHDIHVTINDVEFNIAKEDSKQKALKVLANTFYGEAGNFLSSLYALAVAAGITCAGQYNIKKVAIFVTEQGYLVHYGDTDSCYMAPPEPLFIECDKEYYKEYNNLLVQFEGVPNLPDPPADNLPAIEFKLCRTKIREIWWTEQVKITMKSADEIKEIVGDMLLKDNGTLFLKMAYEEVLFPAKFDGKKKYYGQPHVEIDKIEFDTEDFFIKGIDIIKQGQAGITKKLVKESMKDSISPSNELNPMDLAIRNIKKFYSGKHDPKLFVQTARYRPDKQNMPVRTFVKRMKIRVEQYANDPLLTALYEPPEPNDKFEYVIVKKETSFTLQGKRIELKKGDRMEYYRSYIASLSTDNPMELDLNHYMKNAIIGLFSRFVSYYLDFQPPMGMYDITDKEQYQLMDQYCIKAATKYFEKLSDEIAGTINTNLALMGREYRHAYKIADDKIKSFAIEKFGLASNIFRLINPQSEIGGVVDQIKHTASTYVTNAADYGKKFLERYTYINSCSSGHSKLNIYSLKRAFMSNKGIFTIKNSLYNRKEAEIIDNLRKIASDIARISYTYGQNMATLIMDSRAAHDDISDVAVEYINELSPEETQQIMTAHNLTINLMAILQMRENLKSVTMAINTAAANFANTTVEPMVNVPRQSIMVAQKLPPVDDYNWG